MNDRELLELAAKAAGLKIDKSPYDGGGHGNTGFDIMGNAVLDWHNNERWNPLTDDGDALRLAVKLSMKVYPGEAYPWDKESADYTYKYGACVDEDECPDSLRATRRAIVLAAAKIGKAMPLLPNPATNAKACIVATAMASIYAMELIIMDSNHIH